MTDSMTAATARRGEQTRGATDRKIAHATMQIALSQGVKAVTIEEVARQSGVAKTTIYRRFRNREELLENIAALDIMPAVAVTELAPTRENLELLIRTSVRRFDESVGVKAIGLILCSDTDFFRQVFERVVMPVRDRVAQFFERGLVDGVFRADLDIDFLLEQVLGAMVARAAIAGSIPADWPRQMADFLWPAIVAG